MVWKRTRIREYEGRAWGERMRGRMRGRDERRMRGRMIGEDDRGVKAIRGLSEGGFEA